MLNQIEYNNDLDSLQKTIQLNDEEVLEEVIKTMFHKYDDHQFNEMLNKLTQE